MELVIDALMANYCRDPAHPTLDEMRKVYVEIKAMRVYETAVPQHETDAERPEDHWCAQKTVVELIEQAKWAMTEWELYRRLLRCWTRCSASTRCCRQDVEEAD